MSGDQEREDARREARQTEAPADRSVVVAHAMRTGRIDPTKVRVAAALGVRPAALALGRDAEDASPTLDTLSALILASERPFQLLALSVWSAALLEALGDRCQVFLAPALKGLAAVERLAALPGDPEATAVLVTQGRDFGSLLHVLKDQIRSPGPTASESPPDAWVCFDIDLEPRPEEAVLISTWTLFRFAREGGPKNLSHSISSVKDATERLESFEVMLSRMQRLAADAIIV